MNRFLAGSRSAFAWWRGADMWAIHCRRWPMFLHRSPTWPPIQRGGRIVVQFTVPVTTTEGHPIPPPLRTGPARGHRRSSSRRTSGPRAPRGFPPARRPVNATPSRARRSAPQPATSSGSGLDRQGNNIRRACGGGNGKQSGWSNFVGVPVVAPPEKPTGVTADHGAAGRAPHVAGARYGLPRLPQGGGRRFCAR